MIRKSDFNVFSLPATISWIVISVYFFSFCNSAKVTTNVKLNQLVQKDSQQTNGPRSLSNCTKTQFVCDSHDCIKKSDLCNGVKDCEDGSDETLRMCKDFKCPTHLSFKCDYGACIAASLKCDGRPDCADKSDETNRECAAKAKSNSFVLRRCQTDQWRCKTTKECISKRAKCNGRNDCDDGSDESVQDCKSLSATTTIKPKPLQGERPANGVCNVPSQPDITVVLTDGNDQWLDISLPGFKAPKFSKLEIFCNAKHAIANGEKVQQSVCLPKGQWNPPLRSCQKSCPTLRPDNADISCFRDDLEIDCNGELINGTRVRPRCKPLHHSDAEVVRELRCLENGEWDSDLLKCIPDCGIPNSALADTETLINDGKPINASDSPWHVAIYKLSVVSAEKNSLICGGTLIWANMVLSAAHCFVDLGRGVMLNSSSDYEIVVSKYTRNYKTSDNDFQKTYKIREIIFTDQGFNPLLTGQYSNDIAVLLLRTPVEMNKYVLPACVDWSASDFQPAEGTPGKLVGWGEDKIKDVGNQVLLYANLPFISFRQCLGKLKQLDPDKFCAGSKTGAGARKGDSGGGLMFRDPNTKRYYVRGIVSTRDREGRNNFATFTDISKHIDWLERVRVKVTTELSESEKTSVGVCDVQYGPDRKVELFDDNDKWLSISSGSKAPEFSTIEIFCNPTYALASGETSQRSVCFQKEKWNPPLKPCLKVCKILGPLVNIDLSCYREGSEIGCNNTLISGTVVRPRCKNLYQTPAEVKYRELRCQEDGEWDKELFECVPGCGVPNTELVISSTWRADWIPSNASDSPWHVAIYRREKKETYLHCCGTLISAHLVISAAECFYNATTGQITNSTADYEIVVGKYTSNYKKIDNEFQKKYDVRELIQPYTDSRFKSQRRDIIVLALETRVEFNKFVLPACIDWESGKSGFQPAEGTLGKFVSWAVNVSSTERRPSILRHVELSYTKSCSHPKLNYDDLCTKSNASEITRSRYNGGGLMFRDSNVKRYFLRGIASGPYAGTFTDISKHITWLKTVHSRVEGEQTKADASTSSVSGTSNGICDVPVGPDHKAVVTDGGGVTLKPSPGWKVPKFSKIEITCSPKYALSNGEKIQRSVCLHKDTWNPSLKPCSKICQSLEPVNIDLSCFREGLEIDCNDDLVEGTTVRPRCKNLFKIQEKVDYRELECLKNGEWDRELFKCEPDCGIPNTELVKLPVTSPYWIPGSDSPWHAAIFKPGNDGKMMSFCCGTLVSANMIVSAGSCFYNITTGKISNLTSEYEVLVSKYTYEYDAIDNDFQKKYKIRDLIFSDVHFESMHNVVVLVLKTPVDINKFVLPACVDWNSGTTGFRLAQNKFNVNTQNLTTFDTISLQVELMFCSAEDACGRSNTTSNLTWVGYNGGGLMSRDLNSGRYFLRGIASRLYVETIADISKYTEWLKKVRDRVGRL